jgi:primosomal protein N' (replication factor Y)
MPKIAKLAIQSGLPQLDRLFDYSVPETLLEDVQIGSRVKISFGKSKKSLDGFVVELGSSSEFEGKLSPIEAVVGDAVIDAVVEFVGRVHGGGDEAGAVLVGEDDIDVLVVEIDVG